MSPRVPVSFAGLVKATLGRFDFAGVFQFFDEFVDFLFFQPGGLLNRFGIQWFVGLLKGLHDFFQVVHINNSPFNCVLHHEL